MNDEMPKCCEILCFGLLKSEKEKKISRALTRELLVSRAQDVRMTFFSRAKMQGL
jgi:hypothetical protein